ncbi:MAG: hypothetical protein LBW77_01680 [Verrucomicrobiota bacterium]|jgi:hypothetical protein|nr:hypothetical protein [Verrucomicrobiota bacterium]
MKRILMTALLMAGLAEAESAVSDEAVVDTRGLHADTPESEATADTRSHTEAWTAWVLLNTKRIIGTLFFLK